MQPGPADLDWLASQFPDFSRQDLKKFISIARRSAITDGVLDMEYMVFEAIGIKEGRKDKLDFDEQDRALIAAANIQKYRRVLIVILDQIGCLSYYNRDRALAV